ncbi:U-box domain-containing protein [Xylaria palmicola]|nr:U-box domain-containing protein [Xylaria palmicola]
MPELPHKDMDAYSLKEKGNTFYKMGYFNTAEAFYSQAILKHDREPTFYTNRAMARTKQDQFQSASVDCQTSIKLGGPSVKANYLLSQCLLALRDFDGALENALVAHRLGVATGDKSLPNLTRQVLCCKKDRWSEREKNRSREGQELENQLIALLQQEYETSLMRCQGDAERVAVSEELDSKLKTLSATFEAARAASEKKREIPDWAIDDITFGIMVDPVVTRTGKSYERASILQALEQNGIDPLSRQPLHPRDLRPNLGLRQACEEFLEQNGWAADW